MYRLLIADDEIWVRKGLKRSIDFSKLNIELVGEAENGRQLLDLVTSCEPDLIISDIKMPLMDGLSCFETIAQEYPQTKLILISGYEEFSFAKRALKISVMGYLLKPVDRSELNEVLVRSIKKIDDDKQVSSQIAVVNQNQATILDGLMHSKHCNVPVEQAQEQFQGKLLAAALVYPENISFRYTDFCACADHFNKESCHGQVIAVSQTNCYECVLVTTDDMLQLSTDFFRALKLQNSDGVSIGVGQPCKTVLKLKESYRSAVDSILEHHIMTQNELIYFDHREDSIIAFPTKLHNHIIQSITRCEKEISVNLCEDFIAYYSTNKTATIKHFKGAVMILLSDIIKLLYSFDLNKELINLGTTTCGKLEIAMYMEQFHNSLISFVEMVCDELINCKGDTVAMINQLTKQIQELPGKDYSLVSVSKNLHISECYFSMYFKKITGTNFQNFVAEQRIIHAQELLRESQVPIKDIAEMVGYDNSSYFGKVFHKAVGKSPKQYRTDFLKKESL